MAENDRIDEVHLRLLCEQAEDALERQAITQERTTRFLTKDRMKVEPPVRRPTSLGRKILKALKSKRN